MTDKELERLERIATQLLAGQLSANGLKLPTFRQTVQETIVAAQELIKQLDALKIPE